MRLKAMAGFLSLAAMLAGCRTSGRRAISTDELVAPAPAMSVSQLSNLPATTGELSGGVRRVPEVAQSTTPVAHSRVQQTAYLQAEEIAPPGPAGSQSLPLAPMAAVRLNLIDAIEMSLDRNPDLVALRGNEQVSEAAYGVARTYPFNPFVQIQATPIQQRPGGGSGSTYHYVLLMQTIQLAHQQSYREQVGMAMLNSVRWNIHNSELLNLAQTERLYFTALYMRGLRDLAVTNSKLNAQLLSVLERQMKAGAAAGVDVATVRMDYESTRRQARLAETNYQTALLDLKRQLGVSPEATLDLQDDLTRTHWLPGTPDRLAKVSGAMPEGGNPQQGERPIQRVVNARPDVLAALADVDTARAAARLANASRVPDLQIGPYYQRTDSGTDFYGFRAQTDIMVFNTGMPLLRQREAELRQRSLVWQQLRTRAALEAGAAVDRYERARELLAAPDFRVASDELPIELQKLEEQFVEGEVDIVRLFQARTSTIQNRRAALDTLNEVAQAAAQVTAMTGIAPENLFERGY